MKIVYQVRDVCDYVGATTAKCQLPLYGRWTDLTINAYCLGDNPWDAEAVAMSYGVRPLASSELLCSALDATPDGFLPLSRGNGGNHQVFDQEIRFPAFAGTFFDKQVVQNGGVPAARNLIRGILRGTESMAETIRQSIRCSLAEHIADAGVNELEKRYGAITRRTLNSFLGELHWRLMLAKSGCDEQQLSCIEFMAANNPPRFFDVNYHGDVDIPLVGERPEDVIGAMRRTIARARYERERQRILEAEMRRQKALEKANVKARGLLEQICGEEKAKEFDRRGYITVKQDDFTFRIPPNGFIRCTDRSGKGADLCIHTRGFQCNPIDEIVIAYLHIRHKLIPYLREAIVHRRDRGFKLPV